MLGLFGMMSVNLHTLFAYVGASVGLFVMDFCLYIVKHCSPPVAIAWILGETFFGWLYVKFTNIKKDWNSNEAERRNGCTQLNDFLAILKEDIKEAKVGVPISTEIPRTIVGTPRSARSSSNVPGRSTSTRLPGSLRHSSASSDVGIPVTSAFKSRWRMSRQRRILLRFASFTRWTNTRSPHTRSIFRLKTSPSLSSKTTLVCSLTNNIRCFKQK